MQDLSQALDDQSYETMLSGSQTPKTRPRLQVIADFMPMNEASSESADEIDLQTAGLDLLTDEINQKQKEMEWTKVNVRVAQNKYTAVTFSTKDPIFRLSAAVKEIKPSSQSCSCCSESVKAF
jgi:hypothetical protein